MKMESDFHRHWIDFTLSLVETLSTNLIVEGQAEERWKTELLHACGDLIAQAQEEHRSLAAVELEDKKKENIDMLECTIVRHS